MKEVLDPKTSLENTNPKKWNRGRRSTRSENLFGERGSEEESRAGGEKNRERRRSTGWRREEEEEKKSKCWESKW